MVHYKLESYGSEQKEKTVIGREALTELFKDVKLFAWIFSQLYLHGSHPMFSIYWMNFSDQAIKFGY